MPVESAALIKTLNKTCLDALQAAAGLCVSRTNYNVEIEHWLFKLAEAPNTDLAKIFKHFDITTANLTRDLTKAIDAFKTGNARTPSLAPSIDQTVREAWVLTSIQFQATKVRSGALLLAALSDDRLGRQLKEASGQLAKIGVQSFQGNFLQIVAGSGEDEAPSASQGAAGTAAAPKPGAASKTPGLDQYTVNLTTRAKEGKIDPIFGRDAEVRQMVDILRRRRQNNPILTGEAGVGKTAVVEGFAMRIASGDVPPPLKNVELRTLDMGLLQAGAGMKGEFENRLKQVIEEVKSSPIPIILFIDEAHTMIGAGGPAGQSDAANLLKPALARGDLRTIAATTWSEYKQYFERDAALVRRFQVVKIEEPSEDRAMLMMRGITGMLEKHHGVRILDEAVEASVRLSHRYIPNRQLPDKSVSLLDTACARVAISQTAIPPVVEDCRRLIEHLKIELEILARETLTGGKHSERVVERTADLKAAEARLADLEKRWESEKGLVEQVKGLRDQVEAKHGETNSETPEVAALRSELDAKAETLRALQTDSPLMQVCVDAQTIAEVVAGWTGIPVGKMLVNEIATIMNLKTKLEERVIGQSHSLHAISQRIQTSRAGLTDPRKPIAVFMLVGPSGVGKTETAISLADTLYGGERNLITVNMSEYKEEHAVSTLRGSPIGYVGSTEGGVLTEAIRQKPYSVVLLDEVEKAHPKVMEVFFQVFDKGVLTDGQGNEIDCKNCVFLLTSNVGTDTFMKVCADPDTMPEPDGLVEALRPDLLKAFAPALLGRMIVVPYYPLSDDVMKQIIRLQLGRISRRMKENHKAAFTYDDDLVANIAGRCTEVDSGARNVDAIMTRTLLPELSQEFLARMAAGEAITKAHVSVDDKGGFIYTIG